eukprot:XP_011435019.1 PREDICTED: uncharacterized protein LOC105333647 [Crassostrea gigas]
MFNLLSGSCPYQNWTSVARERCPNPDHFHCLKDEYGRIGWVCNEPIWVEKDKCPVFNIAAKDMDITACSQTRCPPFRYRSNDIDIEYACRYIMDRNSSTTSLTTESPETNSINIGLIVALTLVAIVVCLEGILFYRCRRQQQASATETPDTVKEASSWLDQTNYKSVLPEW